MARKNTSPAEDFMDVVAMLPWWAAVVLAVISYLVLRPWAQAAQFVVPLICMSWAVASYLRRRRREFAATVIWQPSAIEGLNGITCREPIPAFAPTDPFASPVCPLCESSMEFMTAKMGAKTGTKFWGCTRFPECRGTR